MATQSNILAWSTVWPEEPGGLVHGVTRSWTQLATNTYFNVKIIIMLLLAIFHCCECDLGLLRSVQEEKVQDHRHPTSTQFPSLVPTSFSKVHTLKFSHPVLSHIFFSERHKICPFLSRVQQCVCDTFWSSHLCWCLVYRTRELEVICLARPCRGCQSETLGARSLQ